MSTPVWPVARTPSRRMPVWEELIYRRDELELAEWIANNAPEHIKRNLELGRSRPWLQNADGIYYRDLRAPITTGDHPSVTLAATAKALWVSTEGATALPANYWTVGKHIEMTALGRMTSAATPGNLTVSINNSVTDAGGTAVSSNAVAWTASKTAATFHAKAYIHCRSVSSTGTLMMTGKFDCAVGAVASTLAPLMIPDNTPATVTQDTTAAGGITFQALRSGSTAETMQVHDLLFEAVN
jgi:hypothetical protein